ncbi:MAG: PAS domain S-box protein [Bacteroidetes bacterium]|nr:PAS domain S-box protein [Bacteroidota bacterium]
MIRSVSLQLFFLTLVLFGHVSFALDPSKRIQEYKHKIYKHKEGLPQYSISSIAQTPEGYLWFGTNEGLARFDGFRFTVFDKNYHPQINHNTIRSLFVSNNGTLYIGTANGLTILHNKKFALMTSEQGLSNPEVTSFLQYDDSTLWVGTKGGGIVVIRGYTCIDTITTNEGLLSNIVDALVRDKSGVIYAGGPSGITKFLHGRWRVLSDERSMIPLPVRVLYVDKINTFWVGTDKGLYYRVHEKNQWKKISVHDGLPDDRIRALYEDSDGNLWIGTYNGLARLYKGKISTYLEKDGLSSGIISSLYEDFERTLWIGTLEGGVNQLYSTRLKVLEAKDGLLNEEVRPIFQAKDGTIWVGTNGGGITRYFHDGSYKQYTVRDGLPSNSIRAISEDYEGGIWIGTGGAGVARLFKNRVTKWTSKDGLGDDYVFSIFVSTDSTIWIGTRGGGVTTIRNGLVRTFTTNDGLSNNNVRCIYQTRDGNIWLCTNNGVSIYRDGKFHTISRDDGLSYDVVYSIHEDKEGTLWIGTYGGGLNRIKDGKIFTYTKKDGLYDNGVFQILEDQYGNLWLTCNRGIYSVRKSDLALYAQGALPRITSIAYTEVDGMKNAKCNGSAQPAGIRARSNILWIPTMEGVVLVDPTAMQDTIPIPKALIEEIHVKRKPVAFDSLLVLDPNQNDLDIFFTAVSFIASEKLQFEYILQGYDSTWIVPGNRRFAVYTNIPAGEYIFRVRASNRNGVWSNTPTAMHIIINPHFYETFWFRVFLLLASIGGIVGFIRIREYRARVRERELRELVEKQTKHLEEEIEERKKAERELAQSRALYFDLVETAQDLIWQTDIDGNFVYLNPAWEKVLGYPLASMIGKHFTEFQPKEYAERDLKTFQWALLKKNTVSQYETVFKHRTGSLVYLVINSKYYTDNNGNVAGTRGTAYDITERKRIEELLRESEERYRNLIHLMPIGIIILREKKVIFANPYALKIFGLKNEVQLWGKEFESLFDEHEREIVSQLISCGSTDFHIPREIRISKQDGSKGIVELTALRMTIHGMETRQVLLQDVTERRLLQEELLLSQKLQSIGTLAGGIAHDFNNILGIIIGYASRMEMKLGDHEKQSEYIKAILTAAERGSALVRQILLYARKTSTATQPVNVETIIDELIALLKQTFPKIIEFQKIVPMDVPILMADPTQIHQALLNLCVNARDAMPHGGTITIEVSIVKKDQMLKRFTDVTNENYLCIRVTDTGHGMDEETQKRIFDPFFTTKDVSRGTGLGLSVVYGIVKTHHGFIDVQSSVGQGTTFHLYFPLDSALSKV